MIQIMYGVMFGRLFSKPGLEHVAHISVLLQRNNPASIPFFLKTAPPWVSRTLNPPGDLDSAPDPNAFLLGGGGPVTMETGTLFPS